MEEFERETKEEIRWLDGVSNDIQSAESDNEVIFIQIIAQVIRKEAT